MSEQGRPGFWSRLWRYVGGGARKGAAGDFAPSMFAGISRTGRPPIRGAAELLVAYSNNPRYRSVIDRIAHTVAATTWRPHKIDNSGAVEKALGIKRQIQGLGLRGRVGLVRGRLQSAGKAQGFKGRAKLLKRLSDEGAVVPLDSHPSLDLLNSPNPHLTSSQVRQVCQIHLETVGETFLVVEKRAKSDTPGELWPIPPPWVRRMPMEGDATYDIRYPNAQGRLVPMDSVIWVKYPDPSNPYGRGTGIGTALNTELDTDEYAAQTCSNMFWNNATPDLLVSIPGLGEEEAEAFRRKWMNEQQGYHRAKLPKFTNSDINVKQLSSKFVDLDLVNLRKFTRDAVREAYAIPPEIVGVTGSSNRAAITEAQRLFGLNVLIPRLDMWEDYLNNVLLPMFGEGNEDVVLLYENPLPEDLDTEASSAAQAPWALSVDEWRTRVGLGPLDKGGDQHMVPIALTPTRLGETASGVVGSESEQSPKTPSPKPPPSASQSNDEENQPPAPKEPAEPKGVVLWLRKDERTDVDERFRAVIDAVDGDDMYSSMEPLWHDQVRQWMADEMAHLGAGEQVDVVGALAREHLKDLAANRIPQITETTRAAIGETLAEGLRDGETTRDLIARVRDAFDEASAARAELIARTETNRSSNWAIRQGQKLSGITKREWVANRDSRTRDEHAALDGQVVGIDEPFTVAGYSAMAPGDSGDPSFDCNCRCVTSAVVGDEDEGDDQERALRALRRQSQARKLAVWRAFDRSLQAWDRAATTAVRAGLAKQAKAVVAAVRREYKQRAAR